MSSEIAIPVVVKVKLIAAQFWGVVESIDGRTDESLGILNSYGFDDSPELSEQVMIGVVEAILEKEKLVTDASYRISLKVVDDSGRLLGSSSRTFRGHSPPEIPMNWRLAHKKTIFRFLPYEDKDRVLIESPEEYARRLRTTALPNFPEEVLIEWFYRAWRVVIEEYAFLDFESLHFEKQVWNLEDLPGIEACRYESVCVHLASQFQGRLENNNWLARYMKEHGTWNTPIILMENPSENLILRDGHKLKRPYHLLEGNTRLSFLTVLRLLGQARKEHEVWIVRSSN